MTEEMKFRRKLEVEFTLNPTELGELFAEMDADSQAAFFEAVGRVAHKWEHAQAIQWAAMIDALDKHGRGLDTIRSIAGSLP